MKNYKVSSTPVVDNKNKNKATKMHDLHKQSSDVTESKIL